MTVNSRAKGQRGERAFAAFVRDHWNSHAYRGRQYHGRDDAPDVVTDIEGLHFEVKCVEALNIHKAWQQAHSDAGRDAVPVVAFKRNRGEWMLCVQAVDAESFAHRLLEGIRGVDSPGSSDG